MPQGKPVRSSRCELETMAPRTRFDVEDASFCAPARSGLIAALVQVQQTRVLGRNAVGSVKRALQSVKFINP